MDSEEKTVRISPNKVLEMVEIGLFTWKDIGLETVGNWPLNCYTLKIIDKKKYLLARIKYGI